MAPDASDVLADVARLPGVTEAVDDARAAVDRLRGHRVLRRSSAKVAGESALRGARASAALDGADLPLDVVRRTLHAGGVLPEPEAPLVSGALRVAVELGSMQAAWRRAPLQVLARLHTLAAAGTTADESLGRPRPGGAPADRLAAVARLVLAPTGAPALVRSAVVHGELLDAAAFEGANGVVARAAARLVLVTGGLDPDGLSAPDVGHVELGAPAYEEAARGYAQRDADGIAAWVVHCATAVRLGAREGVAICEAVQRGA
jgi:hypothetical protein